MACRCSSVPSPRQRASPWDRAGCEPPLHGDLLLARQAVAWAQTVLLVLQLSGTFVDAGAVARSSSMQAAAAPRSRGLQPWGHFLA